MFLKHNVRNCCYVAVSPVFLLYSITGFFVSKQSAALNEKSHRTMISNNLKESLMNNLTDADKSSALFSEPLKVNFELGNEVWDDYDDGSLIYASTLIGDAEKTKCSGKAGNMHINQLFLLCM